MAYIRRPAGYTVWGVRIGQYGRKLIGGMGCEVNAYVDEKDISSFTPNGTRAWQVRLPKGTEVQEPPSGMTASGRKRKTSGPPKRPVYKARWSHEGVQCQAEWLEEDKFCKLPTTFTVIRKDGELLAGSRLAS